MEKLHNPDSREVEFTDEAPVSRAKIAPRPSSLPKTAEWVGFSEDTGFDTKPTRLAKASIELPLLDLDIID